MKRITPARNGTWFDGNTLMTKSLSQVENANHFQTIDNSAILAILIDVYHSTTGNKSTFLSGPNYKKMNNGANRQRLKDEVKAYNRIAIFVEIAFDNRNMRTGRSFCIVARTQGESLHLLQTASTVNHAIGDLYLVREPDTIDRYANGSMPIVSTVNILVPVAWRKSLLHNI